MTVSSRRKLVAASLIEGLESRQLMAGAGYGFAAPLAKPMPEASAKIKLADLNGDGKQDVISISEAFSNPSRISVLLGNGDGTFQAALQTQNVGSASPGGRITPEVELVDVTNDGKLDLVISRLNDSSVYVMSGSGGGMFNSPVQLVMPASVSLNPGSLAVGDFNGDHLNDIAVATAFDNPNAVAKLAITFGGALGSLWATRDMPNEYGRTGTIRAGDFDRDGVSDLAILGNGELLIWSKLNQVQTTVTPGPAGLMNSVSRYSIDVVNLRGPNQAPGLVITGRSETHVKSRFITIPDPIGAPTTGQEKLIENALIGKTIPGDFNGDGYNDAVACFEVPGAYFNTTGSAGGLVDFPSTPTAEGFGFTSGAAADLNNDGLLDFVGGSYYNPGLFSFLQVAPSLTVTTAVDEDNGSAVSTIGTGTSLREAFNYAKSLGGTRTITFAPSLGNANAVINMTGPMLSLSDNTEANITIRNDTGRITINGDGTKTLFVVPGTATLNLHNLNITNFNASLTNNGGAVYVDILGALNVTSCTFSGNNAVGFGGAIFSENLSFVTIRNSTFANNGGTAAIALDASAGGTATLENNTIANNAGGGVRASAGNVVLRNNIIANNGSADLLAGTTAPGGFFTGSTNIIRTGVAAGLPGTINADPQLGALAVNGGPTPTMLPGLLSPALDAASPLGTVTTDQRGIARPQFGTPDLGAVELASQDMASMNAIVAADGALWFISPSTPGVDQPVYRKAPGQPAAWVDGAVATRLSTSFSGTVFVQNAAGQLYMRPGSPFGIGTGWSFVTSVKTTDNATWFAGPEGLVQRWPVGGSIAYAGVGGFRVGLARDGSVLVMNELRNVFSGTGSASGNATAWPAQPTVTARDGATWFVGPDIQGAFQAFSIYRWDAGNFLQPTNFGTSGNAIYTANDGQIVVRNVAQEYYLIPGSESGIGSNIWIHLGPWLQVTTTADELDVMSDPRLGSGTSLREALAYAEAHPGPETITFAAGLIGQTITLSEGWNGSTDDTALRISSDINLQAPVGGVTLAIPGGTTRRHVVVESTGSLAASNLIFTGGNLPGGGGSIFNFGSLTLSNTSFTGNNTPGGGGGAIYNAGTATITGSTFTSNHAGEGGAIQNTGTLNISTSTFSSNSSDFNGGALRLFGTTTIDRSTFSGNNVVNQGGALISFGNTSITNSTFAGNGKDAVLLWDGTANLEHLTVAYNANGGLASVFANTTLRNSIVAGNAGFDQTGTLAAGSSNNLLNVSASAAGLGSLAFAGGPTPTIELLPGSPAINAGLSLSTIDQRGIARPQGSASDLGAYERQASAAQLTSASYEYLTRQAVNFTFNADASVVFDRSAFTLTNLTTNQVLNVGNLLWSADGTAATLVLTNLLPDGNYRVQAGTTTLDFFVLAGDVNRDRAVNFDDLLSLAQRYGQAGDSTQGDVNYDGQVNFDDLLALTQRYGTNLPAASFSRPGSRNTVFNRRSERVIA